MNAKLIISLATPTGRENYIAKQQELIKTLPMAGDVDAWILNTYPPNVTPHQVCPYLFKYELIKKAMEEGYTKIYWMDSSMRILKNPFELLEQSESGIVAFHNLGHETYKFITDKAVENLRCESYLHSVRNSWGGCHGWDFDKPLPFKILEDMLFQASIGSFDEGISVRDGFISARHDQSVFAILLHEYGVKLLEYGVIADNRFISGDTYIKYGD